MRAWRRIKKRLLDLQLLYVDEEGLLRNADADEQVSNILARLDSNREAGIQSARAKASKARYKSFDFKEVTQTGVPTAERSNELHTYKNNDKKLENERSFSEAATDKPSSFPIGIKRALLEAIPLNVFDFYLGGKQIGFELGPPAKILAQTDFRAKYIRDKFRFQLDSVFGEEQWLVEVILLKSVGRFWTRGLTFYRKAIFMAHKMPPAIAAGVTGKLWEMSDLVAMIETWEATQPRGKSMDRTTKIILAFIAAGLWANAAGSFIRPASAQSSELNDIAHDVHAIYIGTCINDKIC